MDRMRKGFHSEMGVPEAGTSSRESLSFTELERIIASLFDEGHSSSTLVPQPESLSDFFVVDKLNYFVKVSAKIMETKAKFLQMYESLNKTVEDMAREIMVSMTARKEELVRELWSIKVEKVGKWDQQLAVCNEGMRQLRSQRTPGFDLSFRGVEQLQQELRMIDAGEIKLDADNFRTVVRDVKNLGTISTHLGMKWASSGIGGFKNVTPKFTFGTPGSQPGEFCKAWGVCSDATGRILVCDRSNHRVQIFDESGKFLLEFGKEGSEPGKFNRPSGIDVDVKCRIVVADKDNHRIQVFTYSGYYLFEFGNQGSAPGQFQYPWDVSVNKNCDIAVSDSKNHRVQLFNEQGRFITLFDAASNGVVGTRSMLKFLDCPRGLAFRPDGSLLVTDFNNHRILLISKNFSSFTTFGCEGICPGQFFRPQGVACDKNGRIAVSDSKNYRIQVFDRYGNTLGVFGSQGHDPGQFDCPQGISFNPNQDILVVDLNNCRVQVF